MFAVWAKPAEKNDDTEYQEDDGQDDRGNDYEEGGSSGPVTALSVNETVFALPGTTVSLPCEFQNSGNCYITRLSFHVVVLTKKNPQITTKTNNSLTDSVAIEWRILPNKELFLDGLKITNDERIHREKNKSLTIQSVNLGDTAEYRCQAMTDPPVRIVHKLFVTPEGTHVKVLPNEKNDIEQGESITITCQAGEDLKPTSMHWSRKVFIYLNLINNHYFYSQSQTIFTLFFLFLFLRQGKRVHSEHSEKNGQVRAISLAINNATRHVSGDYQCIVETGAAEPIVKHLELLVKRKFHYTIQ